MASTSRWASASLCFLALGALTHTAQAQGGPLFEMNYATKLKAVGVGAGYGIALGEMTTSTGIWGQLAADFFFPKKFEYLDPQQGSTLVEYSQSYWEFNFNFLKPIKPIRGLYLGSGINYATRRINGGDFQGNEDGANLGLSVLGGFHFGPWKQAPFVQARYEFGGGKQFIVSAGVGF